MATRENFELAGLQFENHRTGDSCFLARSRPELFCQAPDHGLGFRQQYIVLIRILDRYRSRRPVRDDFTFVDAPGEFMQANAITPEATFECGAIESS